MSRVDEKHAPRFVADILDVMGNGGVPGEVITGAKLADVVALAHPPAAGQHDVVLVA